MPTDIPPEIRYMFDRFGSFSRFLHFDQRGTAVPHDADAHELVIDNLTALGETGEAERAREVWDAAIADLGA